MKKNKKAIALLLTAVMSLSLPACGNASGDKSSSGDKTVSGKDSKGKVEINFFHRWPNDPKNAMFQGLIKEYMDENPNVTIKMDAILNDQYKEKIRMVVTTDEIPDVFSSWSGTFAQEMINSGNVMELNEIYDDDTQWSSKIAKASVDGFTFDDKIYGIPWSQDGKVFFYNKKIFEETKLETPKTWKEFINVLDELKKSGYETPVVEGLSDSWAVLHYLGTMNQRMVDPKVLEKDYDSKTGEFTDPAYQEVLEKWKQLTSYMGEESVAIDHETARNTKFATGEAPIMYMQLAEIPMLEKSIPEGFEYGFFNFPAFEEGKGDPQALTGAPEGFMISKNAKNPEECVKFLKWLVSKNGGAELTKQSGEISSVDGAVDESSALPSQLEAMEIIKSASTLSPWFDNACDPSVYTVYGQGAQAIVTGDETPQSVMEQVQEAAASLH
ncbi:extracellular solute-binding protein [Blautia liquoris]|uniref:Extracellular solute-binding protein n=1 Tax=Blautia liquoris TaxID=2779518 RepID=A0A7M2RGH7_9FIRM|nr:extracellular solute-binding protein [Blautia liquoris]QOV19131.1 extracellular solute-binding protein [Blautia liquoris]